MLNQSLLLLQLLLLLLLSSSGNHCCGSSSHMFHSSPHVASSSLKLLLLSPSVLVPRLMECVEDMVEALLPTTLIFDRPTRRLLVSDLDSTGKPAADEMIRAAAAAGA